MVLQAWHDSVMWEDLDVDMLNKHSFSNDLQQINSF